MPKGVAHVGKEKGLSLLVAQENQRDGWDEKLYRKKNEKPTNNYDWSRHGLNFEIADGHIIELGGQEKTLYQKYQILLEELGYKDYKAGASNKQNTYVEIILSGSTDRMQKLAFGDQEVNYDRNPDTWHNWHVYREKAIEEWALDTYRFVCRRFGKENVIGFEVHLDETEPHAHVNIVPTAIKKQRGNVGGYVKVDANGNPMTYTKGKHVGEVIKLSKGKYDALSEEKKKEYRPAVRGTVRTISFAEHFGSTNKERSEKMSELHDEYHRQVGAKWGLDRGDVWSELPEEERRKRRRRTKQEAYEEQMAKETKEKAQAEAKKAMEDKEKAIAEKNAVEKDLAEKKADVEKMGRASLYDKLAHSGLSPKVRKAFKEKDEAHQKELHQAAMATYPDGSPVTWENGDQLTWHEWTEYLLNEMADDKKKHTAEKKAAVEKAQNTAKAEYDVELAEQLRKQAASFKEKILSLKEILEKGLMAFDIDGTPILWRNGSKEGQQMTKEEFINSLRKQVDFYQNHYHANEKIIKDAKELIMNMLQLDMKGIVEGILKLLKDGVKEIFGELKNVLLAVLDTMKTIEDRRKYVNEAFDYTKIIATIGGVNIPKENLMLLHEDAMRIADGTWEEYHKQLMEHRKQEQESKLKRNWG